MTLLERTQILLSQCLARGHKLRDIADASDGTVNLWWLKKFASEDSIDNPGVKTIQSLHDCLQKISRKRN